MKNLAMEARACKMVLKIVAISGIMGPVTREIDMATNVITFFQHRGPSRIKYTFGEVLQWQRQSFMT